MANGGCKPSVHMVSQAVSPDKSKVAFVYEEEARPLVETYTFVYIKPVGRPLDERNDLVFRGGDMNGRAFGPVNIQWSDDGLLHIGYCSGRTEIFRNAWADVRAALPVELAVELDLESQGAWPVTTPPDRRAGPPPCT